MHCCSVTLGGSSDHSLPSAKAKLCVLGTLGLLLAAGVGGWVIVQCNCMTHCYTHHWEISFCDREQTSIS